mgnify:CR=1 FL=1
MIKNNIGMSATIISQINILKSSLLRISIQYINLNVHTSIIGIDNNTDTIKINIPSIFTR